MPKPKQLLTRDRNETMAQHTNTRCQYGAKAPVDYNEFRLKHIIWISLNSTFNVHIIVYNARAKTAIARHNRSITL